MDYTEWEAGVPDEIKADSVWKSKAYRLALFVSDIAWHDATKLLSDKRTLSLSDQLYRAACAVSADLEEGYSRASGRDRARFYEYALGSARETRGWYYKAQHILTPRITRHRLLLLTEIIKLLLTMIPNQRDHALKEAPTEYTVMPVTDSTPLLLESVPM